MVEVQTRRDVELVTALLNAAVQVVVDTEHPAFRDTSNGSPQALLDAKEMTAHALLLIGHILHRTAVPLELVGTEDALVAHVVVVPVAAFGYLPLTGYAVRGASERLDLRVLRYDAFDDPAVVGCCRHRVGIHEANPTVLRHQCRELVVRFAEVLFRAPRDIVVNFRCHAVLRFYYTDNSLFSVYFRAKVHKRAQKKNTDRVVSAFALRFAAVVMPARL